MGLFPGLLKSQKGGVGTFAQLLVGSLTFAKCGSIPYHVENVILDLEGETDVLGVSIESG
jgi:hypothetical protein